MTILMESQMGSLFIKVIAFIIITLVGVSCYAFFLNQSTDCSKDLSCIKLTTNLVTAWKQESLDSKKIKNIAKANGFKYDDGHIYGKIAPYEIGRKIYFDPSYGGFLVNTSQSTKQFNFSELGRDEYKGGTDYYSINNLKIEKINLKKDSEIEQYFSGLLFIISEVGQVTIDYERKSVVLFTSDYWDNEHSKKSLPWLKNKPADECFFRKGERILPPC